MASILQPGQMLFASQSQSLTSNNGQFVLVMQSDGNLVLYRAANWYPLWASGTNGQDVNFVAMQSDGNLVIYTYRGRAVWASNTAGNSGSFLIVQDDGNVVIYRPNVPIWSTGTNQLRALHLGDSNKSVEALTVDRLQQAWRESNDALKQAAAGTPAAEALTADRLQQAWRESNDALK